MTTDVSSRKDLRIARRVHGHAVRDDIQALRAFAVLAVVLYHLWPERLPGGFIGVDVFFVISGFLITGQLVRRRERGSVGLASFWAARAKRLLPASLLVLVVSVFLVIQWAPATLKQQYLESVVGSSLYVENWFLAANAVDYLAKDNQPPIAQHYWSLSVEEQFYVLWPLLIILATIGFVKGREFPKRRLLFVVLAVSAASFALSLWLTTNNPPYAYFATPGRMWEFGLGAIVALLPSFIWPPIARVVLFVAAWLGLACSLLLITGATPFPGTAALLPTVATAVLIAVGPGIPIPGVNRLVGWRPIQYLGDQSYGIYLWHWPLIVIAPAVLGQQPSFLTNLFLLGLTIVLAAIVKKFVEDPIRFSRRAWLQQPWKIGIATVVAMALLLASAVFPIVRINTDAQERAESVAAELVDPSACRGASMLLEDVCEASRSIVTDAADVTPALAGLYEDTGGAYACYDAEPSAQLSVCSFGSTDPEATRIALTGDSHAAMLIPALREIAESNKWAVDTFVGRGCIWLIETEEGECTERRDALSQRFLSGDYDVILETGLNPDDRTDEERDRVSSQLQAAWTQAAERGVRVVAVADNPNVPQASSDCVASAPEFSLSTCAFEKNEVTLETDPMRTASAATGAPLLDFSDAYCLDDVCPMVLGGVVVYRDLHHITATFSTSLGPYLEEELVSALQN